MRVERIHLDAEGFEDIHESLERGDETTHLLVLRDGDDAISVVPDGDELHLEAGDRSVRREAGRR